MKTRHRIMLLLLMFAGACAYFGVLEVNLSKQASVESEEISLQDLIQRGPHGNPNILLTDFAIVDDFAIEKKAITGRWVKVWVPIVPVNSGRAENPANIQAVIFSDSVENEQQVRERFDRPQLQGLIDSQTATPGLSATLLWKRKSPDLDLKKCIVIVEGKAPATVLKLAALWGGCAALVVLTGLVWYFGAELERRNLIEG